MIQVKVLKAIKPIELSEVVLGQYVRDPKAKCTFLFFFSFDFYSSK